MNETPTSDAQRERPARAESILEAVEDAFGPEPNRPVKGAASGSNRPPVPSPPRPSVISTVAGPPGGPGSPALASPDPVQRRKALERLVTGIPPHRIEAVVRILLNDPDPALRQLAARALLGAELPPRREAIQRALLDPSDAVRAIAVGLMARSGTISPIVPLVGDRAWPLTQRAAMERLSEAARESGALPDTDHDRLLFAVSKLDPPPLPSERHALQELARAIGVDRLVHDLHGSEANRFGAARLLSAEGSTLALRSVAGMSEDPFEPLRSLAGRARADLETRFEEVDVPAQPRAAETEPASDDLLLALARSLDDPAPTVRDQARIALSSLRREDVAETVERTLRGGGDEEAAAAADVAASLRLIDCAAALLERAGVGAEHTRAPYARALASMSLTPEELVALAAGREAVRRSAAVRVVWEIGGEGTLPFLVSLLEDSVGAVRMAVLEVFAESGDPAASRLALELVKRDSSAAVRAAAVQALAKVEGQPRTAGVVLALSDPDPDVRATAVEALPLAPAIAMGGEAGIRSAADLLVEALADEDPRVAQAAADRLAGLPERHLASVWAAMRAADPSARAELVRQVERRDPGRLASLALAHASSADAGERALAVELAVRSATPQSTAVVVSALGDPDPAVRRIATAGMSSLRSPSAVEALSRTLSDPRPEIRVEAVRALGLIDDDAVPSTLITALKDPEVRVRDTAVDALVRWRSPAVAWRLAQALSSPDLRRPTGDVLERMGSVAVDSLVEVVMRGEPEARAAAGALLERIAGVERFLSELGSTDPDGRLRAVEVLGTIGGRMAGDALVEALTDPDVPVRSRSATLLGAMGDARAIPALKRMFLSDPVVEVAVAAEASLRALGSPPERGEGEPGLDENT